MPFISNNNIRIHYQIEGSGPPLVLHHGLSDSIEGWYEAGYVERLRNKFQLIMLDARGHGRSDKPHNPEAYDFKLMASDVIAVLDSLSIDRAYYSGNSLGCRVGFAIAKYAPERIQAFIMGGQHPYRLNTQVFRDIFAQGLDTWVSIIEAAVGPLLPETRKRLLSNDISAMKALVAKDWPDVSNALPAMTMPCRLFVGGEDRYYDSVKQAAKKLPKGDFVPLPELNHFQVYMRGDIVAPLITLYALRSVNQISYIDS